MITSLILDREPKSLQLLQEKIDSYCPNVLVSGTSQSLQSAQDLIETKQPDLIFLDLETGSTHNFNWQLLNITQTPEVVFLSKERNSTLDVVSKFSVPYLKKPVHKDALMQVVSEVEYQVLQKRKSMANKQGAFLPSPLSNKMVGVPTMEGYEFIPANKIIRCEGLQKCTRVVTLDRSDIVSSYHLGIFKKLLQPFGFFLPHKSFLINLSLIKKFHKEGTITMVDDSHVPLARRKRTEFLSMVRRV